MKQARSKDVQNQTNPKCDLAINAILVRRLLNVTCAPTTGATVLKRTARMS